MATPGKASKKEAKRQTPAKSSLNTPFKNKWQPLSNTNWHSIKRRIRCKLESMEFKKVETKGFCKFKERKNQTPSVSPESVAPESNDSNVLNTPKTGWTDMSARRQLAIGINEVTKALERNQLRLVLVCKSAEPKHMTEHLIPLSISREVPACQVVALSNILSEPLRLKSVLALGFRHCKRKEEDHFLDLVTDIIPMVPPLHVAWLQDKGVPIGTDELLDSDKRGQKRKLEDELEITECDITQTEVSEAVSGTLQPLCVKKVIPNPNKKRKKKIKK